MVSTSSHQPAANSNEDLLRQSLWIQQQQLARDFAEHARPSAPFNNGSPQEYLLLMAKFDLVAKDRCMDARAKLLELANWVAGNAKEVVEAYSTLQPAEQAYAEARRQLDMLFGRNYNSITAIINSIKDGKQLKPEDHLSHVNLYAQLRSAYAIAASTGNSADLDRPDILRNVVESRLEHLSVKFWKKNAKNQDKFGTELKFEDMMAMLSNWIRILAQKGIPIKNTIRPTVKIAATEVSQINGRNVSQARKTSVNATTRQPAVRCSICGESHTPETCPELLKLDVEGRIEMLYEKRLCYHCMAGDHVARLCNDRPQCGKCGKSHATALHERVNLPATSKYAIRSRAESSDAGNSTETSTKSPAAANPTI